MPDVILMSNDRHLNTRARVWKFYDVILTTFLVQNFQKFAHGVLLHSSMSVQNLVLFAWKGAKLGGGGEGDLPPLVWAGFENPGVGFIYTS